MTESNIETKEEILEIYPRFQSETLNESQNLRGSNIKYLFKFYTFIEIFISSILDEFQGNKIMCEHVLMGRSSEHVWI